MSQVVDNQWWKDENSDFLTLSISAFPGSPLEMGYNSKFLARRTSPHLVFTFFRAHLQPLTPCTPCPHNTDCLTAVMLISSISTCFPALAHGVPPRHLAITKLKYHLFSEIPSCHPLPWRRAWSELLFMESRATIYMCSVTPLLPAVISSPVFPCHFINLSTRTREYLVL